MGKAEKASSSHNAYHPHPYASSSTVPQSRASRVPSHALPSHDRPSIAWSAEDDERLIACRKENMNWGPIATQYFPSKTPNACRKRHERLMEKKKQEGWDGVKLEELATVYLECHEEMWQLLATKVREKLDMNEKWQTLESKCMEKGLKTLTSVGRSVSRRSNRGPSTSPVSHSSDQDKFRDSGLGPDHSRDSLFIRCIAVRESGYISALPIQSSTGYGTGLEAFEPHATCAAEL
ncbi:MAG: hypothetical protein Q9187_003879 [Circinaria calcarea]